MQSMFLHSEANTRTFLLMLEHVGSEMLIFLRRFNFLYALESSGGLHVAEL